MSINDLLFTYLRQHGYTGALQEMWEASDLGQMTDDELWNYLGDMGYTGAINDRLYSFLRDNVVDSDAFALFERMDVQPDDSRKAVIEQYVSSLKTSGVWDKLDMLYVLAAHDSQAALLNWKGPQSAILYNSPTFTIDRGVAFDGTSQYGDTVLPLSDMTKYSLNSAHIGAYLNAGATGASGGAVAMGASSSTGTLLVPYAGTGNMSGRLNNSTTAQYTGGAITTRLGHSILSRLNSTLSSAYRAGVLSGTRTATTGVVPSAQMFFGASHSYATTGAANNFTANRIAVVHAGGGLTAAESLSLYTATQSYLTSVGGQI